MSGPSGETDLPESSKEGKDDAAEGKPGLLGKMLRKEREKKPETDLALRFRKLIARRRSCG